MGSVPGDTIQARTLRKAAAIVGGAERLRTLLDAPPDQFAAWLDGSQEPPRTVFLLSVDVIVDELEKGSS